MTGEGIHFHLLIELQRSESLTKDFLKKFSAENLSQNVLKSEGF